MSELIRIDHVSLWRSTQEEFSYDLKKTIFSLINGKPRQRKKKLVLDNIDLVVESGEKIGLIGANGSGKSTLLKLICGILQPTSGSVRVKGKIAPLIELGAGFDEELSVMDNIIIYGVMLGFSRKEMKERSKEILEFAELKDYQLTPVKALSSGMKARLGFAIATDTQPDILILDEVLSVGDESFKNKCEKRLNNFWDTPYTVITASHDLGFIRTSCQRAIWLDKGTIKACGNPETTVNLYLNNLK